MKQQKNNSSLNPSAFSFGSGTKMSDLSKLSAELQMSLAIKNLISKKMNVQKKNLNKIYRI